MAILSPIKKLFTVKRRMTVKRGATTYLAEQGWTLKHSASPAAWHGYYRTQYKSFKGRIEATTPLKFSLQHLPPGLERHSHKACFTKRSDGWYAIHFSTPPKDLDSGVMAIERILHEAVLLSQKPA
jgi:hypothetical protein